MSNCAATNRCDELTRESNSMLSRVHTLDIIAFTDFFCLMSALVVQLHN